MLGKILRALLHKPWEHEGGEGAPHEWEFRVDPRSNGAIALFNPHRGDWVFFKQVRVLRSVTDLEEADRLTEDWMWFTEDPED